ncbi:adenylate/guanylate cyclase domain-containing protein [Limnoraphis robusta]|uniref:adenylate/guanylate cyclase domain-containing protein n=1 Tax=Limnoraphis robusta TaxID=1118279 RepID=UPI00066D09BE|nr:adenylate/guanylate cyclase domain-containing protein [Limnoraphis robusta]
MSNLAILCVDDQGSILLCLTELLKRYLGEHYEIIEAQSGEAALEILEDLEEEGLEIALLIVDQIMPGMKGDELLVKVHDQYPTALKIMLTGGTDTQPVIRAINEANLYRYITKPWDETDLILTVREALRRYSQEKTLAFKNQALKRLNASLEQKVAERTSELIQANQKLKQQISERQQAEEELQLLLTLSQVISSAPDFETALEFALETFCETTNWIYGEVWIPATNQTVLECSPIWYCCHAQQNPQIITAIETFRSHLEGITFKPGEGIAGRVWQSKQPEWIANIEAEIEPIHILSVSHPILIKNPAKNYGLKAHFAVPIMGNNSFQVEEISTDPVLAVLVFFMRESRPQDQRFVELVYAATAQLGVILQQKKAEAEIKALFTAMTEVVIVLDDSGRGLKLAPTHQSFYTPEGIIGRKLSDYFPLEEAERLLGCIQTALKTKQAVQVEYSMTINQRLVWLLGSISPLTKNTVMWVSRDISQRKIIEEALKTNEAKLRHVVHNVSSAIVQWDKFGRILFINEYGLNFFGYQEAEILGQPLMGKLLPEVETSGRDLRNLIENICENPEQYIVHENENIRRNGERVWVTWINQPIFDENGHLIEVLSVATDTTERRLAEETLRLEREKSERLLLNIFPKKIVERLKEEKQGLIAEKYDEVSILFADLVNFTALSERLTPIQLVKLLNEIFSTFDQLAEGLDLEKIKTIGDAYMMAAGLPLPREDHAEAIADMALSMQLVIDHFPFAYGEALQIRIGIHLGSVVAGVIGTHKFIYDLWGDTVNIAYRMESSGEPGKIQVTEAFYEQLKDEYIFEKRGLIPIKGKGKMMTYWLIGRK